MGKVLLFSLYTKNGGQQKDVGWLPKKCDIDIKSGSHSTHKQKSEAENFSYQLRHLQNIGGNHKGLPLLAIGYGRGNLPRKPFSG
ncbi:MAG: hypothetical protein DRR19_33235 [Candidatus Parabeggiatoa sp. nov. 1]|nr:MAG: hypothetical protein DRR19_33235 [Gammaproteobacteria bacterium]